MKYIYLSILIVVSGLLFFSLGVPQYKALQGKRIENKEIRLGLNNIDKAGNDLDDLIAQASQISLDDLNKVNAIVPTRFDNTIFAHYVSRLAIKHNLVLKSITSSPSQDDASSLKSFDVSIVLSGKYDEQVKQFLSEMSKNIAWSRATKISASKQSEIGDMNYEITVRTYANQ